MWCPPRAGPAQPRAAPKKIPFGHKSVQRAMEYAATSCLFAPLISYCPCARAAATSCSKLPTLMVLCFSIRGPSRRGPAAKKRVDAAPPAAAAKPPAKAAGASAAGPSAGGSSPAPASTAAGNTAPAKKPVPARTRSAEKRPRPGKPAEKRSKKRAAAPQVEPL